MRIEQLTLHSFRNHAELKLQPHSGVNLIFGQNGAGKTNILEALHFCALGRSHRTTQDRECIRREQPGGSVSVRVRKKTGFHDVEVRLSGEENRGKGILIDGKRASRMADLMGKLQCVMFSPEDLQLIKGGPALRRRWLDMLISQLSTPYFIALQQYQKAMNQRNSIIRDMHFGDSAMAAMLDVFEEQMAAPMVVILKERKRMLSRLSVLAQESYRAISGPQGERFTMRYRPCDPEEENDASETLFREKWKNARKEDEKRGSTGFGIHREDIVMLLSERDMKVFASQGQIRTGVLSLKIAQLRLFEELCGEKPVLLLDDVMSELDMSRRKALLQEIGGGQTFVTCTDPTDIEQWENCRSYRVSHDSDLTAVVEKTGEGPQMETNNDQDPDFS